MPLPGGTLIADYQISDEQVRLVWDSTAMFIHEMAEGECRRFLQKANIGRLGCALNNRPYVMPINFAFDGNCLYGFTTLGQKVEWMRSNPLVCLEVDEITTQNQWMSIIVFGRYEELPDIAEFRGARNRAYAVLQKRPMWWEPAYISQEHRDQPHSLTPIFYRIHIEKMTGHRATLDEKELSTTIPARTVRRWLKQLLCP